MESIGKCFFCKSDLLVVYASQISTTEQQKIVGIYCEKCAVDLDPQLLPISNIVNSSRYDKLPDGRQNECMKIFGPRNQHWYHCETCFPNEPSKGYCIYCSLNCAKKKHSLKLHYCAFICDSG